MEGVPAGTLFLFQSQNLKLHGVAQRTTEFHTDRIIPKGTSVVLCVESCVSF